MTNIEFTKTFHTVFQKVATTSIYSMEKANEIGFFIGVKACEMPAEISKRVEEVGGGCCFHHSWRLLWELNKAGITDAYWAGVPEGKGAIKCVVVYVDPDGNRWVADIVEELKDQVSISDYVGDSCKRINSMGEIIDNSQISLEQAAKNSTSKDCSGFLRIYPKPNSEISFEDYYKTVEFEEILT